MTWSDPIGALDLPALRAPSSAEGEIDPEGRWLPPRWARKAASAPPAAPPDTEALAFARGYEAGRRECERRAGEDLVPVLNALQRAAERIEHAEAVIDRDRAQMITVLSLAVARHLVLDQLEENPERVSVLVMRALELVPHDAPVEVHVNPEDLKAIDAAGAFPTGPAIQWVADPALSRGDCVVESAARLVDGRLDVALRMLGERIGHE